MAISAVLIHLNKAAIRDFYDIVKNLHDGHFVFSISNGKGISGSFRPIYYRNMKKAGMTDDEIFEAQLAASPETYSDLFAVDEFHAEKTVTIMENTFGIAGASGPSGISQAFGVTKGRVAEYFSKAGYVKTPFDMTLDDENVGNFAVFVGVTKDNILYFSFSGFSLSSFFDDVFQNGDNADEYEGKIRHGFEDHRWHHNRSQWSAFNHYLQESPPSNRSERWRGKEEKSSDVISLQYE